MQGSLMPLPQRLTMAGVGNNVWQSSLAEHGGNTGREFLTYRRSEQWLQDAEQGHARHYILNSRNAEQMRVSCVLIPLITKALVLADELVLYVRATELIRRLKYSDMPYVEILIIDAFNDLREREGEITSEDRFLVESLIEEYQSSRRRVFTAGDKPLEQSLWWSSYAIRELQQRNQEIQVIEDGSPTNRY